MNIQKIAVGQLEVNCYILSDPASREAVIVDPGDEEERIRELIDSHNLKPLFILFTHAHYDHVCAVRELKDTYHAAVIMHRDERDVYASTQQLCISWGYDREDFPPADILVSEGDTISVGEIILHVIHTPGHTPGSICLSGAGMLLTGDTLFAGSVGRTDLPGGNSNLLMASLKKLASLPPATRVLCGHGDETTIEHELQHNRYLRAL